jgi:ribosomal protein L40E
MMFGWVIIIAIAVFVVAALGRAKQQDLIATRTYDLKPCQHCGAANPGHSVFCGHCGQKLISRM